MIEKLKKHNQNSKIALLIRHADRELIPEGEIGNEILINEKGVKNSLQFGHLLQQYKINKIFTSPIQRCVQTSEYISTGYGEKIEIVKTKSLGDPGLHVSDEKKAGDFYLKFGFDEMYRRYINNQKIPGVPTPNELKKSMTDFIQTNTQQKGLTIFVTHDAVIAFYNFAINKMIYTKDNWIDYLSGIILEIE